MFRRKKDAEELSCGFEDGAKELKEAYMRMYGFDYQKACCSKNDFDFKKLD